MEISSETCTKSTDFKKPILGYWNIRGLAHPIRLLLTYLEIDFEDKRYCIGEAPNYDRSAWFNEKETLGMEFPNLPYFIDENENTKVVQSNAILRYIAQQHDLVGKTKEEQLKIFIMQDIVLDLRNASTKVFYNRTDYAKAEDYHRTVYLPQILKRFDDCLGAHEWVCGKNLTFVDFAFYEIIYHNFLLDPSCLDNFPKINSFIRNFENLPRIQEYLLSDATTQTPINNKSATFGGNVLTPMTKDNQIAQFGKSLL